MSSYLAVLFVATMNIEPLLPWQDNLLSTS